MEDESSGYVGVYVRKMLLLLMWVHISGRGGKCLCKCIFGARAALT